MGRGTFDPAQFMSAFQMRAYKLTKAVMCLHLRGTGCAVHDIWDLVERMGVPQLTGGGARLRRRVLLHRRHELRLDRGQ